ncbi:MFS transporter [Pararhizobium antarcticum]|uniref:Arabinose ABC transporter permease n=1 Tax=Pararhizobium antarcticum TaxID=1798805 RepID=A0A657LRQ1_9HYPH|nr:MFS transporter [Pararhizobium antarcticum]OJF96393.1 arabinose ABC transporter permease [Pararhizobium antarcticum]OJF96724.1 arabinose ABC transporter permease [Rhizobium sp. 58]
MASTTDTQTPARRHDRSQTTDEHHVSPSDIAVGVVIGRTSEFFDFFVFSIASVIVFPARIFPFLDPLTGTLWSFVLVALAFVARPLGTILFTTLDRRYGRMIKLTVSLFLLGTSTVAMGLVPSYETAGGWAIAMLAALRISQGLALGGTWDGLAPLLAITASEKRRGFYAMVPQLGAVVGLTVAAVLFAYLVMTLSSADFLDWGWRYPFFVAFAINVVALFARLRIVETPEFKDLFEANELTPTPLRATLSQDGRTVLLGVFVPLASFAMFHMVTVFPLSWIFLYTSEAPGEFLLIQAAGGCVGVLAMLVSGWLSDRIGRQKILVWGAWAIGAFALIAPLLLNAGQAGVTTYVMTGFLILGFNLAQSSGAVASLFDQRNRYTGSAFVSALSWMFGAGFAPLCALLLSTWFGLFAAGLYLLSGAVCTLLSLAVVKQVSLRPKVQA